MTLFPFRYPLPHKSDLESLRVGHRRRRQAWPCFVGKEAVLVPVVHPVLDQNKRLARCATPLRLAQGVRRGCPPRVRLAIDDGQPRIADIKAAVPVNGVHVGGSGDVEGFTAHH